MVGHGVKSGIMSRRRDQDIVTASLPPNQSSAGHGRDTWRHVVTTVENEHGQLEKYR